MKKLLFTSLCFLLVCAMSSGQSVCSEYYPFSKGCKFEITTYNKKDKVSAIVKHTISEVSTSGVEGAEVAHFSSVVMDKKREVIAESEYIITCTEDKISIDINSLVDPSIYNQFKDMEFEISGTNIELPNDLKVGQKLPDADMLMKIDMSGLIMKMTVVMKDRMVNGKETITTPAGAFDCFVIEYTSEISMGLKRKGQAKQWIAKGVGMVKQEEYNKRGKVMSKSVLTSFSK